MSKGKSTGIGGGGGGRGKGGGRRNLGEYADVVGIPRTTLFRYVRDDVAKRRRVGGGVGGGGGVCGKGGTMVTIADGRDGRITTTTRGGCEGMGRKEDDTDGVCANVAGGYDDVDDDDDRGDDDDDEGGVEEEEGPGRGKRRLINRVGITRFVSDLRAGADA